MITAEAHLIVMLAMQKPERSCSQVLRPQCRLQLQGDPSGVDAV